jgi:hypothetical protein
VESAAYKPPAEMLNFRAANFQPGRGHASGLQRQRYREFETLPGDQVKRRGKARQDELEKAILLKIETIDGCLSRFYAELEKSDLKLADYFRLADLKSIAAHSGDEEVIVRWIDCSEREVNEEQTEDGQ